MNLYVAIFLCFGFSVILLSILILLKRRDEAARRWFYFSLFVAIYAFSYVFVYDSNAGEQRALLGSRWATAAAAFIPATWLYFICSFLEIERRKVFWFVWPIAWFVMLMSLFRGETVISSVGPAKGIAYFPEAGPILHLQALHFFFIVAYGFALIIKFYLREKSSERKHEILALFFATVFGFTGGSSQFSVVYLREQGFDLTPLLFTFPFLMAYAMIRHHVLDTEKIADAFQREKLAAIGVLAASVNHELKNPLYVARGTMESFLENVRDRIYKDGEAEQAAQKAIETSLHQLSRASEIMQRLTDFAKPYTGREYLERISLWELIESVIELAGSQFNLNKIKLHKQIRNGLVIFGNRRQLEEIFFNLIVNACQAMPEGGEIALSAQQRNGSVQMQISDNGLGIPSSRLSKIFEPFYTTKESGTGLGLYITKQLVERNGGSIKVKSTVGKGTTFILAFRVVERSQNIAIEKAIPIRSPETELVKERQHESF